MQEKDTPVVERGVNAVFTPMDEAGTFGHVDEAAFHPKGVVLNAPPTGTPESDAIIEEHLADRPDTIAYLDETAFHIPEVPQTFPPSYAEHDPHFNADVEVDESGLEKEYEEGEDDIEGSGDPEVVPLGPAVDAANVYVDTDTGEESVANADAPKGTVQQIGDSNFVVYTHPNGRKEIMQPRGAGKTANAATLTMVSQVQTQIDQENAAAGFEVSQNNLTALALAGQAIKHRQMTSQIAPTLPKNHPFEIAKALKARGLRPGTRKFRQVYLKETGQKKVLFAKKKD